MRLLDLTLPTPIENLALDEALLEELDEQGGEPILRFWESERPFVVLGASCRIHDDVHVKACADDGVPLLRRASGGGTVLQGPGCLSYALLLPLDWHPDLADIRRTNAFILEKMAEVLRRWEPGVTFQGISDLAIGGRKISGNAQHRKRRAMLFHGTILHGMTADLIARYLKVPVRQPDYRAQRPHEGFVRMIAVSPKDIKDAMAKAWEADRRLEHWPESRLQDCMKALRERSSKD
ncbi:MAG: lipoate--protein ligase family protein [Nitrospiraceae bacterium]|nr:lipoate--protein ligase family protein [Nitrospiraceae bacterium]